MACVGLALGCLLAVDGFSRPLLCRSSRVVVRRAVIIASDPGPDEPARDWDAALRNLTASAGNVTTTPDEEPTYRVASSRERLQEEKKDFVETMNEREENLVNTWGNEAGLLGALAVTSLILCFYIYVGLSGGLDTPRPDIRYDDPVMNRNEDKLQGNEDFLRSTQ